MGEERAAGPNARTRIAMAESSEVRFIGTKTSPQGLADAKLVRFRSCRPISAYGRNPLVSKSMIAMLSEWFERQKRVLPWRDEPSLYRVWISEIMLQQTQVVT